MRKPIVHLALRKQHWWQWTLTVCGRSVMPSTRMTDDRAKVTCLDCLDSRTPR